MDNIKECETCKYFVQHYGVSKDLEIFKLNCGHCTKNFCYSKNNKLKRCEKFEEGTNKFFRDDVLHYAAFANKIYEKLELLTLDFTRLKNDIFKVDKN